MTDILPDEELAGTTNAVAEAEVTGEPVDPNRTSLSVGSVSKLVPVIVIGSPGWPIEGEKLVTVGASPSETVPTTKGVLLTTLPPGEVTEIGPGVAPLGTVTTNSVDEKELIAAVVPLKPTEFCPDEDPKFVPLITTWVPIGPDPGEKLIIDGAVADGGLIARRFPVES